MGYQVVEVSLPKTTQHILVLNGQQALEPNESPSRFREGAKEAVERYALPNPDPATHRFYLRPPAPIPVRRGTVQPANGHQGGGDEVIFDNGAPAKTRYKQDVIPS